MPDYSQNARTIMNSFLWHNLKNSGILVEDQYRLDNFTKEVIPIIPTQQIPEFNNLIGDLPYIVYDYQVDEYEDMWWICKERILYTIVSTKVSDISAISEFMVDLFRRMDESGKDVQLFNEKDDILRFYSVSIDSVSSPEPFETEGGRMSGTVQICYKYSRILDSSNRFI